MSFLATPPVAPATTPPASATIENDGWWPSIELASVREIVRLNGTVTELRLQEATQAAMLALNQELADWKAAKVAQGAETLLDVPASQIGGESRLVALYRRAVYFYAKADLTERYRDFDTTAAGDRRADDLEATIDDARRNVRWAVSDLLGQSRVTVELM